MLQSRCIFPYCIPARTLVKKASHESGKPAPLQPPSSMSRMASASSAAASHEQEALHLVEHVPPVGRRDFALGYDVMNHVDHLFPLHDEVRAEVAPTEVAWRLDDPQSAPDRLPASPALARSCGRGRSSSPRYWVLMFSSRISRVYRSD